MRHLFNVFLVLLCTVLSASENSSDSFAHINSEPVTSVGHVSVINGFFSYHPVDMIIPGVLPLVIERYYVKNNSCSCAKSSFFASNWDRNHKSTLEWEKGCNDIRLNEGQWSSLGFYKSNHRDFAYHLSPYILAHGLTNMQGEISGRTHPNNMTISETTDKESKKLAFTVSSGDGGYRNYKKNSSSSCVCGFRLYQISREVTPSKHSFDYAYDNSNRMASIKALSFTGEQIAQARFQYEKDKEIIEGSHGQQVIYTFEHEETRLLKKVERPHGVDEQYQYDSGAITRIERPDHRFLEIEYYKEGINDLVGSIVDLPKKDKRIGRVKLLKAPAGNDITPIITHRFFYGFEDPDYFSLDRKGIVGVLDALGNKTDYHHDRYERLTHVTRFQNENIYSCEQFFWDSVYTNTLKARAIYDNQGRYLLCRKLAYDSKYNVTQDRIYGDLTGKSSIPLQVNAAGSITSAQSEYFEKSYQYSADTFNLPVYEKEGRKETYFTYKPATNLLDTKLVYIDGALTFRHFYEYDAHNLLVKEIQDDGSSTDKNDLSCISERHTKAVFPQRSQPYGLPGHIAQGCLIVGSTQERLLELVSYDYSPDGFIQHEKHVGEGIDKGEIFRNFDAKGNLITEVDLIGRTTTRSYDSNNNLIFEQGPNPDVHTEYAYDNANRLIRTELIHRDGRRWVTRSCYNALGQKIAAFDSYGNETRYSYDSLGRMTQIMHPSVEDVNGTMLSPTENMSYDALGNLILKTDPLGNSTQIFYNVRGQPIKTVYPDGTMEKKEYTLEGWLERCIDPAGVITSYSYDGQGRVLTTENYAPSGELLSRTSATYNAFHLLSETDAMGQITSYTYDSAGRLSAVAKGDALTEYHYDAFGRMDKRLEHTGSGVLVHAVVYDALDRIIEERQEDDTGRLFKKSTYAYDYDGNRVMTCVLTDEGASISRTVYDIHGQPLVSIDALGNATHYVYRYDYVNKLGQTVAHCEETDPLGRRTQKISDALGRPSQITQLDPWGNLLHKQEMRYDAAGNLSIIIEEVHAEGKETQQIQRRMEYDCRGRVIAKTEAEGTPEQKNIRYQYNRCGQRSVVQKADGVTLHSEYDPFGRLARYFSSDGTIDNSYVYDLNHNLLQSVDHVHQSVTRRCYDGNNRLISETLGNGLTISTAYDKIGRPILREFPQAGSVHYTYENAYLRTITRNGIACYTHSYTEYDLSGRLKKMSSPAVTTEYTYDPLHRLTSLKTTAWQGSFSYDPTGNLTTADIADPQGPIQARYNYDHLNQLTQEEGAFNNKYQCDSLHNRLMQNGLSNSFNALNQLLNTSDTRFTYDVNGNLIETQTTEGKTVFRYDALDRLIEVETPKSHAEYRYDSFNRRIAKIQGSNQVNYLYQEMEEIGSYAPSGECLELRILGLGQRTAIALEIGSETYFPIHDHAGNLAVLLDLEGNTVQSYRYSAFGEEQTENPISPWRYASKRTDPETGLVYFGERYYSPKHGRWITQDPLETADGPNLYAYLHHNPLTHFDAYGCFTEKDEPSLWDRACNWVSERISAISDFCSNSYDAISNRSEASYDRTSEYGLNTNESPQDRPYVRGETLLGLVNGFIFPETAFDSDDESKSASQRYGEKIGQATFAASFAYGLGQSITVAKAAATLACRTYTVLRGAAITGRVAATSSAAIPAITRNATIQAARRVATQSVAKDAAANIVKGTGRNRFTPNNNANGAHTVFRRNPQNGSINHYETFNPQTNPRNPNAWESVKRYDGPGSDRHWNKVLKEDIYSPHIHDPLHPGCVRTAQLWEIPR